MESASRPCRFRRGDLRAAPRSRAQRCTEAGDRACKDCSPTCGGGGFGPGPGAGFGQPMRGMPIAATATQHSFLIRSTRLRPSVRIMLTSPGSRPRGAGHWPRYLQLRCLLTSVPRAGLALELRSLAARARRKGARAVGRDDEKVLQFPARPADCIVVPVRPSTLASSAGSGEPGIAGTCVSRLTSNTVPVATGGLVPAQSYEATRRKTSVSPHPRPNLGNFGATPRTIVSARTVQ
jgi:hypothetical protein